MGIVGESLEKIRAERSEFAERQQKLIAFNKHLLDISGVFSGSPLDNYLSKEDTETCREFLNYMDTLDFPNSQNISMRHTRIGSYAWSRPEKFANSLFSKINSHKEWKGVGYYIGTVAIGFSECSLVLSPLTQEDSTQIGELRCDRDPRSFSSSHGLGFGILPELPSEKLPLLLPNLDKHLVKFVQST